MSSTVQGYVRGIYDNHVRANARVKITFLGGQDRLLLSPSVKTTSTDQQGWFAFRNLDAGSYIVSAEGSNAQRVSVEDFTNVTLELLGASDVATPSEEPVPEPMPHVPSNSGASIEGRVISANGGFAIENATVMLLSGPGSAPDIAPLTGARGEFSFYDLTVGTWQLRAIAPDGASKQLSVDVRADETAIVVIAVGSDHDRCRSAR